MVKFTMVSASPEIPTTRFNPSSDFTIAIFLKVFADKHESNMHVNIQPVQLNVKLLKLQATISGSEGTQFLIQDFEGSKCLKQKNQKSEIRADNSGYTLIFNYGFPVSIILLRWKMSL